MQIYTIDHVLTGVKNTIATYLIKGVDGLILIEPGPASTIDTVLMGIQTLGFDPNDVKHVFVTHVHLDHAGASWWWAGRGAQVYVHPRGARHLIDPSKLQAGARMVFGKENSDRLWGEIWPILSSKVTVIDDGRSIRIRDLEVQAISVEGHARHHHVYRIGDVVFAGDAAGSRMPGEKFINLTSAPPQFDPDGFVATIKLLRKLKLSKLYLAHFGVVEDVEGHLTALKKVVVDSAEFVEQQMLDGFDETETVAKYVAWCEARARKAGVSDEVLAQYDGANPFELSGRGIWHYWEKEGRK